MDTKSGSSVPYNTYSDSEAPPSYNDTISSFPVTNSSYSASSYYSRQISSQLEQLTTQISSLEPQKSLLAHALDEKILSCLTTHIQTYLSDFASTGLKKGILILVPASGLKSANAVPTDYDFNNLDEFDRVVRVRGKEDGASDGSWFWQDEDMAERLAKCLNPQSSPRNRQLPPRKEDIRAMDNKRVEKKGFWGFRKSSPKSPLVEERRNERVIDSAATEKDKGSDNRVVLDVKSEEVCFRTENEFGIYETERGFGIILNLRVVTGSR